MTKPISRRMAVDAILYRFTLPIGVKPCPGGVDIVCGVTVDCAVCHKPIEPGQDIDFDHVHADIFGGPHEYQNLRPLHRVCHRAKSSRDVKDNAKIKRLQAGGRKRRGPKLKSKGFNKELTRKMSGEVVKRDA